MEIPSGSAILYNSSTMREHPVSVMEDLVSSSPKSGKLARRKRKRMMIKLIGETAVGDGHYCTAKHTGF